MNTKVNLPSFGEESNLIEISDEGITFHLHPEAAEAWREMKAAAMGGNIQLEIVSGFRSIARQQEIIDNKRRRGMPERDIFQYSAPAGYSEHHSGRALDINTRGAAPLTEEFENTEAFKWLKSHAHAFGFRLSYPRGNPFGIGYEPWHWFYAGSQQSSGRNSEQATALQS